MTISEFDVSKLLGSAIVDQAAQHQKRSAEEMQELLYGRKNGGAR